MSTNHIQSWVSLPSGWTADRIKDVVDLRDEKVFVDSPEENYLELEDMEGGSGRILSRRDTLTVESAITRFTKGDVLFGKLRPYLEKYAQPDFDGYCTGEILAFYPRRIEGRYLFYHMGTDWLIQRCNALAYGAKMPRVNWPKQLALFDIPLPPLAEQQRIAAYLDASCAAIDRAVETKRKQLETLDALRKSIIQKAVTQGLNPKVKMKDSGVEWLGPIPAHWRAQKLKRVFAEVDYGISQSTEQEGTYAVLKMGNIVRGEIVFTKIEFVEEVEEGLVLETNDLLFNRTNSLDQVAKVGIFRGVKADNVTYASYLVRLRANHKNNPGYLNHLLNAEVFLGLARKMAIPSVQQANLNPTRYCRLEIPVPPLTEQILIAGFLEERCEQIKEIEQRLTAQLATLTAYRKSLIHECVTGKRRISEADVVRAEAANRGA